MARNITINELSNLVGSTARCVVRRKNEYEVPALTSLRGRISRRVFSQGQSTRGRTRQYKSKSYVIRNNKTNPVNLQLTGDTLRDFNNYRDASGNNAIGFRKKESIIKIAAERKRRGDDITFPTTAERKRLLTDAKRRIKPLVQSCLR